MKRFAIAMAAAAAALIIPAAALADGIPAAGVQLAQVRMPQPAPELDPDMRMPVPGQGGGVKGCWRAKQVLYGQYSLSFCLNRGSDGGYQVTGGKLNCSGDIDWQRYGNQVDIRMNRGRCNRNTDWSRDRISCTIDVYGEAPAAPGYIPAQARMPVPSGGSDVTRMSCVYRPVTGPFGPARFVARRDY